MRDAVRLLNRRLAAYAVDVVILDAVLIPLAFGIQALVQYRVDAVALRNGGRRSVHDLVASTLVQRLAA